MGNRHPTTTRATTTPTPIAPFKLPAPLPSWPPGNGFATGSIDLGGLEVRQVSTFAKIWSTTKGGPGNAGAAFYAPSDIPAGFSQLGHYAQPNNKPLFGWVLVARATAAGAGALIKPVDYTLVWSSKSNTKQDGYGYIWLPIPPDGYKSIGHIVTSSPEKPSLDDIRCVRDDFTDECEDDAWVWGSDRDGVNIYGLRPAGRGTRALGLWVGTFTAKPTTDGGATTLACLKNKAADLSSMPNPNQIETLMRAYSPLVYFHPDETYLPSSVSWFFSNGALLYKRGDPSPAPIDPAGSNLPIGGGNDGQFWMDLDDKKVKAIKNGDLSTAEAYIHVKPMLGATCTDIAVWVFYPFNGPARAKLQLVDIPLGKIGQHVGDWEHVTLRVRNFDGTLWRVYFSEHSGGAWVDAPELEFVVGGGNKPVAYASLCGHAFYPKAGLVLQGSAKAGVGLRNDCGKGEVNMDTGARFVVVAAEYLGEGVVAPPAWLGYEREWGPKVRYVVAREMEGVKKALVGKVESLLKGLPDEVLGEEGPTGPKMKDNWDGDERV